jgi:hypothetical protein
LPQLGLFLRNDPYSVGAFWLVEFLYPQITGDTFDARH